MHTDNEKFMREALREAEKGLEAGQVPIGMVLVVEDQVTARAHWSWVERDLLAHPELTVLRAPCTRGATLYTTLEPCVMCMGAAMSGFVRRVVYALEGPTHGAARIPMTYRSRLPAAGPPWSIPEVVAGVSRDASRNLVDRFLQVTEPGPMTE